MVLDFLCDELYFPLFNEGPILNQDKRRGKQASIFECAKKKKRPWAYNESAQQAKTKRPMKRKFFANLQPRARTPELSRRCRTPPAAGYFACQARVGRTSVPHTEV